MINSFDPEIKIGIIYSRLVLYDYNSGKKIFVEDYFSTVT